MESDIATSQDIPTGVPMAQKQDEPTGHTCPSLPEGECKIKDFSNISEGTKCTRRQDSLINKKEVLKLRRRGESKKQRKGVHVIKSESKIKDHDLDQKENEPDNRFTESVMESKKSSLHNIRNLMLKLWNNFIFMHHE